VNPRATEIFGEPSHPSQLEVPEPVDIVNVFRASDALPEIAHQTVQIGAATLWCQFGVINETGATIAENGGLTVIMDRCIKHPTHHLGPRRPPVRLGMDGVRSERRVPARLACPKRAPLTRPRPAATDQVTGAPA
jgi:hypothetical protein